MKHPLRLLIHVPDRVKRDFRQTLVGFKNALCVSQIGDVTSYDLLPSFKPRKGQEHQLVANVAEQLNQGWTLLVWDVEKLWRDFEQIVNGVSPRRPAVKAAVDEAWHIISTADEEQIVDLKLFERFPNGHYVGLVAAREDFDYDAYPPRRRRRLMAYSTQSRPTCEDFWCVLVPLLMKKSDADRAGNAYQRWIRNNRPHPPRTDAL